MKPDQLPSLRFQWLRLIVGHRPHNGDNVTNFNDINDIRNGVFSSVMVHVAFDMREVAILKVRRVCPTHAFLISPPYLAGDN
jgi:hypothetical protein